MAESQPNNSNIRDILDAYFDQLSENEGNEKEEIKKHIIETMNNIINIIIIFYYMNYIKIFQVIIQILSFINL